MGAVNGDYAFLEREGGDIFIPARCLNGAMHGDVVTANVYGDRGEVTKILSVGFIELTGIYVRGLKNAKVVPSDRRYARDIRVKDIVCPAAPGDKVLVRLSRKDRSTGIIVKSFGQAGMLESELMSELHSLGIEDFKRKALAEAQEASSQPVVVGQRRDFTAQRCFTIDGEDSKDFDDAVYAERTETGYRLWVHIADVAHYVPLNSHTDREAYRRGNSFYYGESVIPMLPESLSNGACSLNENEDRYTLSVILDISKDGSVSDGEIAESVIRSSKRMTYECAELALQGKARSDYAPFCETLAVLKELRDVLKRRRDEDGNIDFDIPEPKFVFKDGKPVEAFRAPRLVTHSIIEECMIAANRFIARKFYEIKAPFVYRVHKPPSKEKLSELNRFLGVIGEKKVLPRSSSIAALLGNADPEKSMAISKMTLRSMSKAFYSTSCEGHFGLALSEYCHFTSPIRRYSDLTVHRVIKAYLRGEDLRSFEGVTQAAAEQASERERVCEKAERNIDNLYMCEYMSRFIGKRFVAFISGFSERNAYVELENTAEGKISWDNLRDAYIDFERMALVVSKKVFKLCDKVYVKLLSASSGTLDFELEIT